LTGGEFALCSCFDETSRQQHDNHHDDHDNRGRALIGRAGSLQVELQDDRSRRPVNRRAVLFFGDDA
jgi:hypothetical protein